MNTIDKQAQQLPATIVMPAKVVALESADRFVDDTERMTLRLEGCDVCMRDIRLPRPLFHGLHLDQRYEVLFRMVATPAEAEAKA